MLNWYRAALATVALLFASPLAAQSNESAGLWAIYADGRVLALLDLRREPDAPGGWTGGWIRPERLTVNQMHAAFDIGGPVVRRRILTSETRSDGLLLTIEGRSAETEPSQFIFRLVDSSHAEFGWNDPRMPPMAVSRAEPGAVVAVTWSPGEHPLTTPRPSNPEMTAIFDADQADRRPGRQIDWTAVSRHDRDRRARTLALLNAGALHSGADFRHAAFVFQHGDGPNDYLIAHTLAVIAAARGRPDAAWIAAATLDRYLQNIGQKQIYGTQFSTPPGQPTTQEPYDRALVSDALRRALGVPPQAAQESQRAEIEADYRAREAAPQR